MKGLKLNKKWLLLAGVSLCALALVKSTSMATDASAVNETAPSTVAVETNVFEKPAFNETIINETDYDADLEAYIAANIDVYANVTGTYHENIVDEATGVKYNMWVPATGTQNKPVIFCITGISVWSSESVGFGPHLLLKSGQVTPDAVIVIIQRKKSGTITNSYSLDKVSTFIKSSIIETFMTSTERVYYYGFSQGGVDFNKFGSLYNWRAAAFSDGYSSAMNAATYCPSLVAVMYNNSTGTPSAWNKANADKSAAALGLTEGTNYIWNVVKGSHANVNQYAVIAEEGQGYASYSRNCSWKVNESEGLPQALNWLLQW